MKRTLLLFAILLMVFTTSEAQRRRGRRGGALSDEAYEALAPTPPMGWNSWNKFGCNVSEELIKGMADAMVSSGMRDAGYEYVVIDDCWQVSRDRQGNIVADSTRFPNGMKALADYIHSLGLKFGIYSCAGSRTCQGRPGSKGYQFQDARTYAEWGVDYIKYDWCSSDGQNAEAAYRTMSEAIKESGRPMILSICEWGENDPWKWGKGIGHLWRVTPDIRDAFDCTFDWGGVGVVQCIDKMADLNYYAGPGHWNDAEMLEVGNGGMTRDEYITHFSMWSLLAAPLMSGNDLRDMSDETIEILTNKEVIAVNQDPLGKQGVRFMDMGDYEIWAKPLAYGEIALCFMNRSNSAWNLDYEWTRQTMYFARDINLRKKEYTVRDLWAHKEIGTTAKNMVKKIPAHGTLMVRLSPKTEPVKMPKGKEIYVQNEWKFMNLNNPESPWSYHRMYCTPDVAIFWEKGFGPDPANAPELEGNSMTFDVKQIADRIQYFYDYYKNVLKFTLKGSKADKYRMMCFVKYDLEKTAYGGSVDDVIGGLWVTPFRIQDFDMNCIAHELGHSFQSQIMCDGTGEAWGGSGIFEMASQWMLWSVNNNWMTTEKYHWDAFNTLTHKAFLHGVNMYHSPYVLMYWTQLHGDTFMGDMFRAGKRGEDPVLTYKRLCNLDQEQFNDEMFEGVRSFVNWDWTNLNLFKESRPYANKNFTKLDTLSDGWYRVAKDNCIENYGYNAIAMPLPKAGESVTVAFRGEAGIEGYDAVRIDKAGWRYGFVAVDKAGKAHYGEMHKEVNGTVSYTPTEDLSYLWFVVMGAPEEHWPNAFGWGPNPEPDAQWPYSIKIN